MKQQIRRGLILAGVTVAACAAFLGATGTGALAAPAHRATLSTTARPARPSDSVCVTNWQANGSVAVSTCVGWDQWKQFLGCSKGIIMSPMQFGPGVYTGRCPSGQTILYANVMTYA